MESTLVTGILGATASGSAAGLVTFLLVGYNFAPRPEPRTGRVRDRQTGRFLPMPRPLYAVDILSGAALSLVAAFLAA
jgi:hypothetical protein